MEMQTKLKNNIIYNICYQILSLIVPLITAPYISRVLGKDGMGLYSYTFSIAHYFVLFCMLGILNYGNREIAMIDDVQKKSEKFWQIYYNQLMFGIVALVAYFIFVNFFVQQDGLVYALQALYIVSGIIDISWFYFGIEKFKTTTSISAINKLITTGLIFLLVKSSSDIWIYTLIVASGVLMNNIVYWLCLPKYIVKVHINFVDVISNLRPLILLFIPVIAINVYKYIDKIMLGSMVNVGDVGIFDAAEKLTNIPMGFITAIGTVMLPRISNLLSSNNVADVRRYNYLSLNLVMFLSLGMCFGLMGISDVFIPLFYGEAFGGSIAVLYYLAPCMIFVSWANVIRTQYLLPHKKDVLFCVSVICGAILNVISNIILIPRFGAIGAAVSTLVAEVTVCVFQSIVANKTMLLYKPVFKIVPYLLSGIFMYFVISNIEVGSVFLNVVVRLIIGCIIYVLLSIFYLKKQVKVLSIKHEIK